MQRSYGLRKFIARSTLLFSLLSLVNCAHPRFSDFRGESLGADRSALTQGKRAAEKYCGSCHLTPLPESMSQDNAAFVLAYMGLFHGIEASRGLDEAERQQFRQRFELLKETGAIPAQPRLPLAEWKNLRAYYLGLARYPFTSNEKATELKASPLPFGDQGVTLLRRLSDGRIAVGGAVTGRLEFLKNNLSRDFSVMLDSAPVHITEAEGGYFVLTLGSLLGALADENKAALYFIDQKTHAARKILKQLPRSGHFIVHDVNGDGHPDFILAGFGAVSGGGVFLHESSPAGYRMKVLSNHPSIVRLAPLTRSPRKLEFLALAGGAREALLHIVYENGNARERTLVEYPPHLGSVWMETTDIDGDGVEEILVLSGDNADSGPYNETKPDQGLRIYQWDGLAVKQVHFESTPGALTLALLPNGRGKHDIAIARFYAAPDTKQDLTILRYQKGFTFTRQHFTLPSRPTVLAFHKEQLIIGSGNFPIIAKQDEKVIQRSFTGPVLFQVDAKLDER